MTPFLTGIAVEALTDGRHTAAWVSARLYRAKDIPKLETLLVRKAATPRDKELMAEQLKAALMSYNIRRGN